MELSIYNYSDYKKYLRDWISSKPGRGRGFKSALATALHCQSTYVSQVLLGSSHLSIEQAENVCQFIGLTEDESEFFLFMVQENRAGTENLKKRFSKLLRNLLEKRSQLRGRLENQTEVSTNALGVYFSSWIYSSVHLSCSQLLAQSPEGIAKRLGIPKSVVAQTLEFLSSLNLVKLLDGNWVTGDTQMHLPHDSPFIAIHHTNWRMKAIRDLDRKDERSLHYSSCVSISRSDFIKLREKFMQMIETLQLTAKESSEEDIFSFCLDFFQV